MVEGSKKQKMLKGSKNMVKEKKWWTEVSKMLKRIKTNS